ncbi:hypothetical protein EPO15_05435 [bacterium]|nr:MAG: hypothetical protein EPO15_05435 [bacterium]
MASDIYEYTDAEGRTVRVDDLTKVPKDRLKHMLVIGGEDEPATTATTGAAPKAPAAPAPKPGIAPEVWAVSAFLMLVGIFNKRFMLRVFCVAMSIIWVLYNGYDVFMTSDLARTAEKKPKKASVAPPAPAQEE